MKVVLTSMALFLVCSLSGCLRIDAKDASKEWSEVGKSWADAFKDQDQEQEQSREEGR